MAKQRTLSLLIGIVSTALAIGWNTRPIPADNGAIPPALKHREAVLRGRIVRYAAALQQHTGAKMESREFDDVLALEADDGRLWPLPPTDVSQMFYRDAALLGRTMQIDCRVYEQLPAIHPVRVLSLKDGKPHEIYYWCGICAIKMFQLQDCECCRGPIELKEVPVK